ncbi:MAG: hypothetical protein RLZZ262_1722 [Bacteroidota bacterium]|jgi:hypothetical protein
MIHSFKKRFWVMSKWFGGLFVLLFVFRFIYGYTAVHQVANNASNDDYFSNVNTLRKNYASEKNGAFNDVAAASNAASNQKYEKTASIKSSTSQFDQDEKRLKEKTHSFNAIIQYEQSLGQRGSRQLHLSIGVNPMLFDSIYNQLKQIGSLKATDIVKVDKTNEYRQLNAKKTSIEKTLASLIELKTKGGEISDYIALNDKILEIEEKAQELGVELGNFDSENEFCTVKVSMYEGTEVQAISLLHRVKVALEWTIQYFLMLVATSLLVALMIFVLLLIIDKFKVINAINKRLGE